MTVMQFMLSVIESELEACIHQDIRDGAALYLLTYAYSCRQKSAYSKGTAPAET